MIKTITKNIFVCDMCGHKYEGSKEYLVPKDVFEFTVNLADGAKNIQICPKCQIKLKGALVDKLDKFYKTGVCCILVEEGGREDD